MKSLVVCTPGPWLASFLVWEESARTKSTWVVISDQYIKSTLGKYFKTVFKISMIEKRTIEIDRSQEPSVLKFRCDFIEGVTPLCSGRSPVLPKQLIAMLISRRAILSSVWWGAATMLFFFSLISKINLKVPNSKSYSNMSTKSFLTNSTTDKILESVIKFWHLIKILLP